MTTAAGIVVHDRNGSSSAGRPSLAGTSSPFALRLEDPVLQKKLNALCMQIQFDEQVIHKYMDENAKLKLEVVQLQMKLQTQQDSVKLSLPQDVNKEADSPTPTVRTPSSIPGSPESEDTWERPPIDQISIFDKEELHEARDEVAEVVAGRG